MVMRARTDIEELEQGGKPQHHRDRELPFMVNKARVIEQIAELVREKKIDGHSGPARRVATATACASSSS